MKSTKLRLLHIIPNFGTGGAEMVVKNLLTSHDRSHFEVAAASLFPRKGTIIENSIENSGVKVFYLHKHLGPDPRIMREIYQLFKHYKPDIIHTHRYVIRYILLPSLLSRIPVRIHTVHNIAEKEVDLPGRLIHKFAFKTSIIQPVSISKKINGTVMEYYGLSDVPYIYNGIPTDLYAFNVMSRIKIRNSLNISDNQFVLIHVGRFSPQKNHKLLIEAFSKVVSRTTNALLLLVGDGELRTEINNLVISKGIENNVKFLGLKKNIPELLSASDLFVLSSDWEGHPIVIIEAMAAGKPVVSTSVGGIPEMISNNVNGLLVTARDADELADAIYKIIMNQRVAKEMGERSCQIAKDNFDIRKVTKQYENLYLRCIRGATTNQTISSMG